MIKVIITLTFSLLAISSYSEEAPNDFMQTMLKAQEYRLLQVSKTLNEQLDYMMSDEQLEKSAKATRKFYLELVKSGFTEEQAMNIILSGSATVTSYMNVK